jgi:hypothetical protein
MQKLEQERGIENEKLGNKVNSSNKASTKNY